MRSSPLPLAATQESPGPNKATGVAACYSRRLIGHKTSSGQRYNPNALTAAHATIPLGTRVKVTNVENGEAVIVLVNDRLSAPAGGGIIIDISQRACKRIEVWPRRRSQGQPPSDQRRRWRQAALVLPAYNSLSFNSQTCLLYRPTPLERHFIEPRDYLIDKRRDGHFNRRQSACLNLKVHRADPRRRPRRKRKKSRPSSKARLRKR